ncbi:hypothetical protein C8Q76DRAFT_795113 [Earliella scabrosa]|nr:hypothetical protein C8Q76DRAFT_795113 [Earliella scabrosa]
MERGLNSPIKSPRPGVPNIYSRARSAISLRSEHPLARARICPLGQGAPSTDTRRDLELQILTSRPLRQELLCLTQEAPSLRRATDAHGVCFPTPGAILARGATSARSPQELPTFTLDPDVPSHGRTTDTGRGIELGILIPDIPTSGSSRPPTPGAPDVYPQPRRAISGAPSHRRATDAHGVCFPTPGAILARGATSARSPQELPTFTLDPDVPSHGRTTDTGRGIELGILIPDIPTSGSSRPPTPGAPDVYPQPRRAISGAPSHRRATDAHGVCFPTPGAILARGATSARSPQELPTFTLDPDVPSHGRTTDTGRGIELGILIPDIPTSGSSRPPTPGAPDVYPQPRRAISGKDYQRLPQQLISSVDVGSTPDVNLWPKERHPTDELPMLMACASRHLELSSHEERHPPARPRSSRRLLSTQTCHRTEELPTPAAA